MKKLKRGRGRPPKEMQHIYAMEDSLAGVKEKFADTYPKAMEYIANLVTDKSASQTTRLAASKFVKEQVEDWLEEYYESLEPAEVEVEEDSLPKEIRI